MLELGAIAEKKSEHHLADAIVEAARERPAGTATGATGLGNLRQILDGTADEEQRDAFADAWHRRVRTVLSDESLFTVEAVEIS